MRDRHEKSDTADMKYTAIAALALFATATPISAQDMGDWEQAGTRAIDPAKGTETIFMFGDNRHRQIRLCSANADLAVLTVGIEYANGESQAIPTGFVIARGTCSEPLELAGRRRSVEKLVLTYTPFTTAGGTPRLRVDAR